LHEVDETGLHAHRAGSGDRHREGVGGLKRKLQKTLELVHELDEDRVEVAKGGAAHRLEDPGGNVGRAGSHQGALRRVEGGGQLFFLSRGRIVTPKNVIIHQSSAISPRTPSPRTRTLITDH
jgi:hypothetical protein